jgi:hypothetical protein
LPPAPSTGFCGRIPVCGGSFMGSSSTGGGDSERSCSASTSDASSRPGASSPTSAVSRETGVGSTGGGPSRPAAATARSAELSIGGCSSIVARADDSAVASDDVVPGDSAAGGATEGEEDEVVTGAEGLGAEVGAAVSGVMRRTPESCSDGQPMPWDVFGSPVLFSGHPRARLTNPLTSRVFRAGIPLQHVRPQYSPLLSAGPVHPHRVGECATTRHRGPRVHPRRPPVRPPRTIPSSQA